MECISISFRTAPAQIRGRLAFTGKEAEAFLESAGKAVLVSTCNRTEVYLGRHSGGFAVAEELLCAKSGLTATQLRRIVMRFSGKRAIEHLYRVACGMDSMVLGEDEILGQVREAYLRSGRLGKTDYELHAAFQGALACAKRIKTRTELSRTSVSVATLASAEIFRFQTTEGKREGMEVLLIGGSGKMGSILLKNLLGREGVHVFATRRTHGLAVKESGSLKTVDYRDRYQYLEWADVVVSVTESPHYTLTAGEALEALETYRNRLFLDLAVPSDIDGQIGELPGCRLVSIDSFERLARENNQRKRQAAKAAEEILEEQLEELYKGMAFHAAAGKMEGLRKRFGGYSFDRLIYYLRDHLDARAFEALLDALEEGTESVPEEKEAFSSPYGGGAFPFYIDLSGKKGVILGGGKVAARKIRRLLAFGAQLRCVAPVIGEEVRRMAKEPEAEAAEGETGAGRLELYARRAQEADLEDAFFVIAATDEEGVNAWAAEFCREKGILINAADDRHNCTFYFPALICDGPVTVGISTGGNSPAACSYLRKRLQEAVPEGLGETVRQLGELREKVLETLPSQEEREACLKELFAYCEKEGFHAGRRQLDGWLETWLKDRKGERKE